MDRRDVVATSIGRQESQGKIEHRQTGTVTEEGSIRLATPRRGESTARVSVFNGRLRTKAAPWDESTVPRVRY